MDPTASDSLDVLKTDMAGLYQAHVRALEDFSGSRMNALLAVYAIPLLCLGALVASPGTKLNPNLSNPTSFPFAIHVVFLGTALLGLCVVRMWVASYLLVQWYSRAINVLRAAYVPLVEAVVGVPRLDTWLPTTPNKPPVESGRFVILLATAFCAISGLYAGFGMTGMFPRWAEHPCRVSTVALVTTATFAATGYGVYTNILRNAHPKK